MSGRIFKSTKKKCVETPGITIRRWVQLVFQAAVAYAYNNNRRRTTIIIARKPHKNTTNTKKRRVAEQQRQQKPPKFVLKKGGKDKSLSTTSEAYSFFCVSYFATHRLTSQRSCSVTRASTDTRYADKTFFLQQSRESPRWSWPMPICHLKFTVDFCVFFLGKRSDCLHSGKRTTIHH